MIGLVYESQKAGFFGGDISEVVSFGFLGGLEILIIARVAGKSVTYSKVWT